MTCDANVYGGKTPLIASHIHIADNGNGSTGTGDPVINFCGTNGQGSIDDGTPYSEPCMGYSDSDVSENLGMGGRKVDKFTKDLTLKQLVHHIGQNSDNYYLNFHSEGSWAYWKKNGDGLHAAMAQGMCRGVMQPPTKGVCASSAPTNKPTPIPTKAPTATPTNAPTKAPTGTPTKAPTLAPTKAPTKAPTNEPTESRTTAVPTTGAPTSKCGVVEALECMAKRKHVLNYCCELILDHPDAIDLRQVFLQAACQDIQDLGLKCPVTCNQHCYTCTSSPTTSPSNSIADAQTTDTATTGAPTTTDAPTPDEQLVQAAHQQVSLFEPGFQPVNFEPGYRHIV